MIVATESGSLSLKRWFWAWVLVCSVVAIVAIVVASRMLIYDHHRNIQQKLLSVLKERITDSDPQTRQRAVRYIGEKKEPITYPLLIDALQDPNNEVVIMAKDNLTKDGIGGQAVELLVQALCSDESKLHQAAEDCLVKIGEPSIQTLINALDTEDKQVRSRLQSCLIKMGNRTDVKAKLKEAFEHSHPAISVAAKETLYKMEGPPATPPPSPSP